MEFIRTPILFLIFLLYISLCGLTSGPFTAQAQGPPLPPSTYVPNLQLHAVDTHWGNITYGTIHTRLMSFEVSGQDLSDTVHVLAPEFFEMRIDSLTGLFRNRISIPAVGQLSPTRFYVRLKDSLPAATNRPR